MSEVGLDYGATPSYPSAMQDEKSMYPKIDSGFPFKLHLNDVKNYIGSDYTS